MLKIQTINILNPHRERSHWYITRAIRIINDCNRTYIEHIL